MIIEASQSFNDDSYVLPVALSELLLAFLLYCYPDTAKIFLFGLPLVLLFGESVTFFYKYFRQKGRIFYLLGGILLAAGGGVTAFAGRKAFMLGIAILMLFEAIRFFICSCTQNNKIYERLIYVCAALLSVVWMIFILLKGLHLYWSVREYLALYFVGSAFLSFLRRR